MGKPREWWIRADGSQCMEDRDRPDIDISKPGEDRWIYTYVQTVNPKGNRISEMHPWVHVREVSQESQKCDTSPDHVASEDKQGAEEASEAWWNSQNAPLPWTKGGFKVAFLAGVAYAERKGIENDKLRSELKDALGALKICYEYAGHSFPSYADKLSALIKRIEGGANG